MSPDEYFWRVLGLVAVVALLKGVFELWAWRVRKDPARAKRNARASMTLLTKGLSWPAWLAVLIGAVCYFWIAAFLRWSEVAFAPIAGAVAVLLIFFPGGSFRVARRRR